jgi:hypothetical protein
MHAGIWHALGQKGYVLGGFQEAKKGLRSVFYFLFATF